MSFETMPRQPEAVDWEDVEEVEEVEEVIEEAEWQEAETETQRGLADAAQEALQTVAHRQAIENLSQFGIAVAETARLQAIIQRSQKLLEQGVASPTHLRFLPTWLGGIPEIIGQVTALYEQWQEMTKYSRAWHQTEKQIQEKVEEMERFIEEVEKINKEMEDNLKKGIHPGKWQERYDTQIGSDV